MTDFDTWLRSVDLWCQIFSNHSVHDLTDPYSLEPDGLHVLYGQQKSPKYAAQITVTR